MTVRGPELKEPVCRIGTRRFNQQEKHAQTVQLLAELRLRTELWQVTPSGTTGSGAGDGDEAQGMAAEVESVVVGDGLETISLLPVVLTGAGDNSEPASLRVCFSRQSSRDRFFDRACRGCQDGGSGGMKELSQHSLKNSDTGINGRECTGDNWA